MAIKEAVEVSAVLGEEFDKLLDVLEVRNEFDEGKYKCQRCGDVVRRENVVLIFPLPGRRVGFLCSKPECVLDYAVAG